MFQTLKGSQPFKFEFLYNNLIQGHVVALRGIRAHNRYFFRKSISLIFLENYAFLDPFFHTKMIQ